MRKRLYAAGMALAAGLLSPLSANAEGYPERTVHFIVPYGPGGGTDLTARIVADGLSKAWGQSVVIDNRPGAAASIGTEYVAKAKPDGYTVLWASADSISILPAVKSNLPYKIPDSFEYVNTFAAFPLIIGVYNKVPIHDFKEFESYAKAHPGELHYSSSGAGGGGHLETAYIAKVLGLDAVHVPYTGAGPAAVAVAGGHAQFTLIAPSSLSAYVDAGTIRPIATTGHEKSTRFPDIPTFKELGHPELSEDFYYGMYAPAGTPPDVVKKLREGVQSVLAQPGMTKKLQSLGLDPLNLSGDKFKQHVEDDLNRWKMIAKDIGFKIGQ